MAKQDSALRPLEHRIYRPASSSRTRRRSGLGPPTAAGKRNSMLHVVATESTIINVDGGVKKRKRRYQPLFLAQLSNIKSWFKDPARRSKQLNGNSLGLTTGEHKAQPSNLQRTSSDVLNLRSSGADFRPELQSHNTFPLRPRLSTHRSYGSNHRLSSHSPSPLTPKSSYRRSGGSNMRGRKSTSSSVSSIRSFHVQHHPSHSKASSASSTSLGSPSALSVTSANVVRHRSSPNTGIKVLTPQRRATPKIFVPEPSSNGAAFSGLGPPSPGIIFARRKRTPFSGPKLGPGTRRRSDGSGLGIDSPTAGGSVSGHGRKSNELEIHQEEDEDEYEEVDAFTPIELGESVEFEHDMDGLDRDRPLTKWELEN